MKTGFPHRTALLKTPIKWKHMGSTKEYTTVENGETHYKRYLHDRCNTVLHIGKEDDGSLFDFCPMCLIKVN